MNKQEFQQTIKNMKPPKFFTAVTLNEAYKAGFEEAKGNALCNSCFLNELEKPVVPKFVAEWYEENKYDFEYSLYKICIDFGEQKLRTDLHCWFGENVNNPIETLVKMKLYGYEVEKEKLYTVEIPNPNGRERPILLKNRDGKVSVVFASNPCWRTVKDAKLTEAEIKECFGWAWPFAEEVKK